MDETAAESAYADPRAVVAPKAGAAEARVPGPQLHGLDVLPPLTAVFELAVIVALFLLIDLLWPTLDIHNLQPSVYWLPVLLLTLQYGTVSGSIAAVVAIAATFALSTMPEQGVGENEFTYRLRILAQPILWIGTAVLLGQFRMIQIAAKRELTERVTELESQGRTLADYATRLRGRCDALELEIVARRPGDGEGLLSALARLRSGIGSPQAAAEACLAAVAPGGTASLYARTPAGLQRVLSAGWPGSAAWLEALPPGHPLHGAVIEERRSLSVLDAVDEGALAGQGLAAVPVIDPASGRVSGLIKVEMAPAQAVTPALIEALAFLAETVAPRMSEVLGASSEPAPDPKAAPRSLAAPIPLRPLSEKLDTQSGPPRLPPDGGTEWGSIPLRPKVGP